MTDRCYACEDKGQKPKMVELPRLYIDPQYQRHGLPCNEHGLSAEWLAGYVWSFGIDSEELRHGWPEFTTAEQLVACWWAGRFGTRTWRKRLGVWAEEANRHLWHGCVAIPDPPHKETP